MQSSYSQEVADEICEQIANGKSIRQICLADNMPAMSTVFKWLRDIDGFSEQYAHAREAQAELLAVEIIEIADDGRNDTYMDEEGNVRTNQDVIARSRLRVDARKWIASKLKPKVYGDKVTNEVTGQDGGPVQFEKIERVIVRPPNSNT